MPSGQAQSPVLVALPYAAPAWRGTCPICEARHPSRGWGQYAVAGSTNQIPSVVDQWLPYLYAAPFKPRSDYSPSLGVMSTKSPDHLPPWPETEILYVICGNLCQFLPIAQPFGLNAPGGWELGWQGFSGRFAGHERRCCGTSPHINASSGVHVGTARGGFERAHHRHAEVSVMVKPSTARLPGCVPLASL